MRETFVEIYRDAADVSLEAAKRWADKIERDTGRYVADVSPSRRGSTMAALRQKPVSARRFRVGAFGEDPLSSIVTNSRLEMAWTPPSPKRVLERRLCGDEFRVSDVADGLRAGLR